MSSDINGSAVTVSEQNFERDKVCYEQNFQQFRDMNQIMWQVPILAITITGGLWFAAVGVDDAWVFRRPIFLLSGVLDFALVFVLWRIRYVMGAHLVKIRAFNPDAYVEAPGNCWFNQRHTVIWAFTTALLIAGASSTVGFFKLDALVF